MEEFGGAVVGGPGACASLWTGPKMGHCGVLVVCRPNWACTEWRWQGSRRRTDSWLSCRRWPQQSGWRCVCGIGSLVRDSEAAMCQFLGLRAKSIDTGKALQKLLRELVRVLVGSGWWFGSCWCPLNTN